MTDVSQRRQRAAKGAAPSPASDAEQDFFANNLAYSVMVLANLITRITTQGTLRDAPVNINEWRILRIAHMFGPMSAADIVSTLGMDKTTVSRTITSLHEAGYIKLSANPSDRRQTLIALTAAGLKVHAAILPADQSNDSAFEALLTEAELAHFKTTMSKLRGHAQAVLAELPRGRAPRKPRKTGA